MGKEKFVYNTSTLRYEKVEDPLRVKVLRAFGFFAAVVVFSVIIFFVGNGLFDSPKEKVLKNEIEQMEFQYEIMGEKMDRLNLVMDNLQQRDAYIYRMMFGSDPIDDHIWNAGRGGSDKYASFDKMTSKEIMKETASKLDKLENKAALQSESFDDISGLVRQQEEMLASIPSIRPVRKLNRNIKLFSGYGMRIHPIHKIRKMHWGIDFTAPKGTGIYSTGNGTIKKVKKSRTGYGKHVVVDHGFGYETLYAHMHKIDVVVGQKVSKGELIGQVGSTGTSTAPHLHYEVIYKGKKINPIHFCQDDLTPEEYNELVDLASVSNQSFD